MLTLPGFPSLEQRGGIDVRREAEALTAHLAHSSCIAEIHSPADRVHASRASSMQNIICIAISLKLRGNVSLNEAEVGDMTIDTSPIHSALLQPLSDSDKSVARLRTASEASQSGDVGLTPSTVVSISEAARAVAQNVNDIGPTRPAPAEIASDSPTPPDGNSATDLQQLEVDILSGRRILGISAAEFQAARSSEANSDLLLRAIQDAAQRAGFIQNREIAHNYDGADQTTFQARGVIRTAHS